MIKRGAHHQTNKSSIWEIKLEDGQTKGRALAAYDELGNSLEWDDAKFKDGKLKISFGVDDHIGVLDYEYEEDSNDDPVIVHGEGGVIQVYVTQNNHKPQSQQ